MKPFALLTAGTILGGGLLAGCGLSGNSSPAALSSPPSSSPSTGTTGVSGVTSSSTNTGTGSPAASWPATPISTSAGTVPSAPSTTPASSAGGSPAAAPQPTNHTTLIQTSLRLADAGRVYGLPFVSGSSTQSQVESAWGQPQSQGSAGAGIYLTYPEHDAALGMNKGMQIFDVRSSSATLQAVTMSQVQAVLGDPGTIRHTGNQTIYLYPAGATHQLLWIFPNPSTANPDPHVDHISVFDPADTVDIMAATQPAPSIALGQAPGVQGHTLTFSILQAPKGYGLVEVVWNGTNGQSVVDTASQVQQHATYNGQAPYFSLAANGIFTFNYGAAMVGASGDVEAIYQNESGAAMIGQTSAMTLK